MKKNEIDSSIFSSLLQEMLESVQEHIQQQASTQLPDKIDLDHYIRDLNLFYYRSFQDYFMPAYISRVQQEVSRLLELSRREDMINVDILANLQRYTRLYNRIKTMLTTQAGFLGKIDEQLLYMEQESQKYIPRLFFALRSLQYKIEDLDQLAASLIEAASKMALPALLDKHPQYRKAFDLLVSIDPDDPLVMHGLGLLVEDLQASIQLLQELQSVNFEDFRFDALITGLYTAGNHLENHNPVDAVNRFTSLYIIPDLRLHVTMLDMAKMTAQAKIAGDISGKLKNFLSGWLSILNHGIDLILSRRPEILCIAPLLEGETPEYLYEMHQDVSSTKDTVQSILNDWNENQRGDFQEFEARIQEMLEFAVPFFKKLASEAECRKIPSLATITHSVSLEFNHLASLKVLLQERSNSNLFMTHLYRQIKDKIMEELEHLSNLKADLERLLAPRNLARSWKGLEVKVDRIPLIRGELFPPDHLNLLEEFRIETRLVEDQPENCILYEEGDIFMLSVGGESRIEVPYLVVTHRS